MTESWPLHVWFVESLHDSRYIDTVATWTGRISKACTCAHAHARITSFGRLMGDNSYCRVGHSEGGNCRTIMVCSPRYWDGNCYVRHKFSICTVYFIICSWFFICDTKNIGFSAPLIILVLFLQTKLNPISCKDKFLILVVTLRVHVDRVKFTCTDRWW